GQRVAAGDGLSRQAGGVGRRDAFDLSRLGDAEAGEAAGGGAGLAGDDSVAVPPAAVAPGGDQAGDGGVGAAVPGADLAGGGDDQLVVLQIDFAAAGDRDRWRLDDPIAAAAGGQLELATGDDQRRGGG